MEKKAKQKTYFLFLLYLFDSCNSKNQESSIADSKQGGKSWGSSKTWCMSASQKP